MIRKEKTTGVLRPNRSEATVYQWKDNRTAFRGAWETFTLALDVVTIRQIDYLARLGNRSKADVIRELVQARIHSHLIQLMKPRKERSGNGTR